MAKLQEQMVSSKATKHFSQLAAKLKRRKAYLVWDLFCLGGQETTSSSVSQECFVSVLPWFSVVQLKVCNSSLVLPVTLLQDSGVCERLGPERAGR